MLVIPYSVIDELVKALPAIMASITASVAGIKTAVVSSWFVPVCVVGVAIAIVGIVILINELVEIVDDAARTVSAVKTAIESGGVDPKQLSAYSVYVIISLNPKEVVYVGMTRSYESRKSQHERTRFPISHYKMIPVATGLTREEARALEQTLITAYTLDALQNMINSISPKKWDNFIEQFERMQLLIESWYDLE